MKKMIRFLSVTVVLATAAAAQAQVYVEGAYSPITYKDGSTSVKPSALSGVVGYEINPNLAAEGMLDLGVKDGSITSQGDTRKVGLKNAFGIFLKPKVMLSNEFEVFGRLGFAQTKLKFSEVGGSANDSGSSFAYGLGVNYYLDKKTYVSASYMSLYDKSNVKVTGFNFGVGYKF